MPETEINSAAVGDLENTSTTEYSVEPKILDSPGDQKETTWVNTRWSEQLGYYKSVSPLKRAINAMATWSLGKAIKTDPETQFVLDSIKGNGKENITLILKNQLRTRDIGGDSYAEIVKDDNLNLVNLKPLNPGIVRVVFNRKGMIIRYELLDKSNKIKNKFEPEEIFHLSRNRVGDETHGESIIDAVENIIKSREEAMADTKKLMHRHIKPLMGVELDTDDPAEISIFVAKFDKAMEVGENIYWPKDTAKVEVISVAPNSTLNPLPWIDRLTNYFYEETGVPKIVIGGANDITESAGKIVYLSFEQTVSENQLEMTDQVGMQLGLIIELEFPVSLKNELLTDESKSETMQASTPEDTAVTNVGVSQQGGVA